MTNIIGDVPVVGVGTGFFEPVEKDTTWIKCFTHSANPSSAINQNNLVFDIPKLYSDWFLFYNRMKVKLSVQLVDREGKQPPDDFSVAPINAFPQTMFSSVKLFLNETLVSGASDGLYPYYAYCSMLLNNNTDRKLSTLQLNGYYEDKAPFWDTISIYDQGANSGWAARRNLFGDIVTVKIEPPANAPPEDKKKVAYKNIFKFNTQEKTFYHDVFTDFKYTDTPMISMVGARLEMTLASPFFYMATNENEIEKAVAKGYYLKINHAELLIPARQMAPTLLVNLEKKLQTKNAEYHLNRMDLRKISLAKGQQSFSFDDIKQVNVCPDRITFFLVDAVRYDGKYGPPALRTAHFLTKDKKSSADRVDQRVRLTDMRLMLNNESLENTQRTFTADSLPAQKFYDTLENLGYLNTDAGLGISMEDFALGKFFCTYDLTRARLASETGNVRQETLQGNLRLDLKFESALEQGGFLFVMAEYHTKVSVDKNRNVIYNYLN